ncbi:MAG: hypothetical protein HY778_18155 [Betaproteobacteria bacterium]|nr:hypothetical protein [Betaproteobacteria bacterium]
MRFWPGQFVLLGRGDAEAFVRAYSIAPMHPGRMAVLHVTRVEHGATGRWLHVAGDGAGA